MHIKQNSIKGTLFLSLFIFLVGTLITSQKVHAHDIAHDFEHLESTSEFVEARSTTQDYFGDNFTILYDDDSDITPFAIGACPYGNGICDAIKRGAAKVYNSAGSFLFHGSAWQCTKCGQAYITEFDLGLPVGRWGSTPAQGTLSLMTIYYTDSPGYTSAYEIPGIQRRYQ